MEHISTPPIYDIVLDRERLEIFFTERQIDILGQIAKEITTYTAIGRNFGISKDTVKNEIKDRTDEFEPSIPSRGVRGNMEILLQRRIERSGWVPALLKLGYATLVPRS